MIVHSFLFCLFLNYLLLYYMFNVHNFKINGLLSRKYTLFLSHTKKQNKKKKRNKKKRLKKQNQKLTKNKQNTSPLNNNKKERFRDRNFTRVTHIGIKILSYLYVCSEKKIVRKLNPLVIYLEDIYR